MEIYKRKRVKTRPVVLKKIIAKRSVVSAANYAQRSSFAKDQILFFFL